MKYNEELFNTSAEYYKKIKEPKENEEVRNAQNELLPILLKKCKQSLEDDKNQNKGIVKVRFKSEFWQNPEEGYSLLRDLKRAGQFDTFASQYGFYLGESVDECNEYQSAFIEVVWDYKTYFESLSIEQTLSPEGNSSSVDIIEDTLRETKMIASQEKAQELDDFSKNVANYRNALSSNGTKELTLNDKNT